MKALTTYVMFEGNCRDAMAFYAKCFGVEAQILPFSEGDCNVPAEAKNQIMHARLNRGGEPILMASDVPPGSPFQRGNNFSINIDCDSQQEIEKLFAALGEKGTVKMPLADMFWGAHWGMLQDQFGVGWMLSFDKSAKG